VRAAEDHVVDEAAVEGELESLRQVARFRKRRPWRAPALIGAPSIELLRREKHTPAE
jgi:hypothetical protein